MASIYIVFLFLVTVGYSQIETTEGGSIPSMGSDSRSIPSKSLLDSEPDQPKHSLFPNTDDDDEELRTSKKKKNFDMRTDTDLMTRKYDYNPSWLTKDKLFNDEYNSGQEFGTFYTNAKSIEILCRDHEFVDGDEVALFHNGRAVIHKIRLRESYQSFIIDLEEGQNIIEFQALNQGSSGPNTAQFRVYDSNGTPMLENEWNLATGVKATLIVEQHTEE